MGRWEAVMGSGDGQGCGSRGKRKSVVNEVRSWSSITYLCACVFVCYTATRIYLTHTSPLYTIAYTCTYIINIYHHYVYINISVVYKALLSVCAPAICYENTNTHSRIYVIETGLPFTTPCFLILSALTHLILLCKPCENQYQSFLASASSCQILLSKGPL